jgi:glycosyltransferase involved in cell wall biosynthesis
MASEMKKLVPGKNLDITIANFGINISISNVPKENIIYSNRLHKKLYRIDKVIEAFCRFNENRINENWKLIIAGSGEETDKLKGIVRDLNIQKNVEFIGWANNNLNADYYNRSKIFVSIPESDATSISLLEAMATGCIPILSDLPSNKEWITDGLNGIIVNNISVNFLEQIMSLNMDKAMEINRNIIQQKGTKEVNKKNFIELYNRILLNNK